MRFLGRGTSSIRATHTKTLEFSTDHVISERATCVVAVDTRVEPAAALAGPVRIRLRVGGESFTLHAVANPSWTPGGPAVIRRSPLRLPGTFATSADAAASDLPRGLVAALASTDAQLEVVVEPVRPAHRTVVLALADPASPVPGPLRAELDVADRVVAEDAGARDLVAPDARDVAADEKRVLAIASRDLPGAGVVAELRDPDVMIETIGLPARLAAAAAVPARGPVVLAPDGADLRELLRTTPADHRLVVSTPADELPKLLELAASVRGSTDAIVTQEYAPPIRVTAAEPPELPTREPVHCCLFASTQAGDGPVLDPGVRAAIARLIEEGVGTRTTARVLSELTGLSRSAAYAVVLDFDRHLTG